MSGYRVRRDRGDEWHATGGSRPLRLALTRMCPL
jgi:hypothetical protein